MTIKHGKCEKCGAGASARELPHSDNEVLGKGIDL
jgi:hypothetical protein